MADQRKSLGNNRKSLGNNRKSLGQIAHEEDVRQTIKIEGGSVADYESWEEMPPGQQRRYIRIAAAVTKRDRHRSQQDSS